jgi:hypothetical protein
MPHVMPMTPAVAPQFAARYPEAAIIFDNLHSMHDVISDILANPSVPRDRKRAEILLAARRYRDDTSFVITPQVWRTMAGHMGIENMGGPAVGFLPRLPTPTVTYGAVMRHDDRTGEMTGFAYGSAVGEAHAQHGGEVARADSTRRAADPHAGHQMPSAAADTARAHEGGMPMHDSTAMRRMHAMHMRMMADPVIRQRMMADTAMHRMMMEMMRDMPAEHREEMERMMHQPMRPSEAEAGAPRIPIAKDLARRSPQRSTSAPARRSTSTKSAATRPTAAKAAAKRATKQSTKQAAKQPTKTIDTKAKTKAADPHAGHRPPQ